MGCRRRRGLDQGQPPPSGRGRSALAPQQGAGDQGQSDFHGAPAARTDVSGLLSTFESRFGFPPGEHDVAGPATATQLAGLAELHGDALPADLLSFHRIVAEVQLPDVKNGYWIHRPPLPGEDPGHPRRLSDGRTVVVFGSAGGGAVFALAAVSGSPVLRLADGAFLDGVYDADCAVPVAGNLQEFLTFLSHEITEFAES